MKSNRDFCLKFLRGKRKDRQGYYYITLTLLKLMSTLVILELLPTNYPCPFGYIWVLYLKIMFENLHLINSVYTFDLKYSTCRMVRISMNVSKGILSDAKSE